MAADVCRAKDSGIAVKDLTKGLIVNHILTLAAPVAIGMLTQIAYQVIDLYFVTRLGVAATAGINAAGNLALIVAALMQVLGIGTVALVAQAVGRKDQDDANLVINQSMLLSSVCGVATLALLSLAVYPYLRSVAADEATIGAGATFIFWMLPGLAFSIPLTVLASALRGIGVVRPTIAFYLLTVVLNAALAPVLIAGWGSGVALGVQGAGLATSISIVAGAVVLGVYFHRSQRYLAINRRQLMSPRFQQWRRILIVGLPVGGEIVLGFLSVAVVYYAIRKFGASAQAGYGIGSRIIQTILLPGMSIGLSASPIIAQNFGARNADRVREAFRKTALLGTAVMIMTAGLVQWKPEALVGMFSTDASTSAIAVLFLKLMSWAFVAQGLAITCSSTFQGFGNTLPSLISTGTCFFVFAVPVVWLSLQPSFRIEQVCYIAVLAAAVQTIVSLSFVSMEFRKKLAPSFV